MPDPAPTARVLGLLPPGCTRIAPVDLLPGQVWSIGRRDDRSLARRTNAAAWHLGVLDARPDLSVNQLQLSVGRSLVTVSSIDGASVMIGRNIHTSPVTLGYGKNSVSPSISGLHRPFEVIVLTNDSEVAPSEAPAHSGTTLALRIELESGSALWRVAHALAWPCTSSVRRPLSNGWSGRDVSSRLVQLRWAVKFDARATTVLSQQLHTLAEKVSNCRLSDGRHADLVLDPWPPWADDDQQHLNRDEQAERRNRCVAEALWRARAVDNSVIDNA